MLVRTGKKRMVDDGGEVAGARPVRQRGSDQTLGQRERGESVNCCNRIMGSPQSIILIEKS
ncbi:leucine-rich repeat extensin-like protein 3 [Iris pallida]|uniref:Leucine-rich repeat extensin-like protein 3 n=1 Tax=Iris pallida TaxID=29817 RepID=A0AAX6DL76_IRIPA|nr:leucine-rich repeat extensin-like protein 3 [Iris pallida]